MKIRIGFDVGGTNIKAGIVDDDLNIVSKKSIPFPKGQGYRGVTKIMYETAMEMIAEGDFVMQNLKSVGIASAGTVDSSKGIIINAVNLSFFNVPIKEEMERYFPGIPVSLINDAGAATLAELKKGALKGYLSAMLLTIGTGIGGGVIINGELFRGGMGHGFEPGHITLALGGPLCNCGNEGCLETLCSASWLSKEGRANPKEIIDSAKAGESGALKIFNEYIDNLSTAIASLATLFDPEIIAIGGGVSLAGDFLFDPLRVKVAQKSFYKYPYKIVPAQLGNDAGIIGAVVRG